MMTVVTTVIAALGAGLVAGIFFAFSIFVMKSFASIPAVYAISAMQEINRRIVKTLFIPLFFGTAAASVYLLYVGMIRWSSLAGLMLMLAGVAYLIGCVLVTMIFNVPRNVRLGQLAADTAEAEAYWRDYLINWTRWNHVRTLASLLAAALFTLSLLQG